MTLFECDAVLFDLDGVLVDSIACSERHWRNWADSHGIDMAAIRRVAYGRRTIETIQLVAPHLVAEDECDILTRNEATDTEGVLEIAGAAVLVGQIPGDRWAVATSGSRSIAMARMTCTGLPIPGVLVTAEDVVRGKPDPAPYLLAARRLHVDPERCVVFEDAPNGVQAARAGGMKVIGITTTHSEEELAGAHAIVKRIADIRVVPLNGESSNRLSVLVADTARDIS